MGVYSKMSEMFKAEHAKFCEKYGLDPEKKLQYTGYAAQPAVYDEDCAHVPATRIHCVTGKHTEVTVVIYVMLEAGRSPAEEGVPREYTDGTEYKDILSILQGGVTGYESFYVNGSDFEKQKGNIGWTACVGTPNRWDRLEIPAESMQQVYDKFYTN